MLLDVGLTEAIEVTHITTDAPLPNFGTATAVASGLGQSVLPTLAAPSLATLADFWAGRANFVVDGRLFGASFGMHFLSTYWSDAQLQTYYITANDSIHGDGRLAIGLARSTDAINFANIGRVIPIAASGWDSNMRSFPGIWKDNTGWYCVYEGSGTSPGDIGLATSADGVRWAVETNPILVHQSSWERNNIGTPSLYKVGITWYLFYHGFGSSSRSADDCQVGVATGTNLRQLTKYTGNPIVRTSSSGWDCGTIGKRSICFEEGYYYMVYEGSTDQPYDKARWSCGLARATNLLGPWEKCPRNPVLPITTSGFGYDGPEWVRTADGALHIYFRDPRGPTGRASLITAVPVNLIYEAERDFYHQQGVLESGGWSCHAGIHSSNFMLYGPYTNAIPSGSRSATYRMMVDNNSADNLNVVTIEVVVDARYVVSSRQITRREFLAVWSYQDFTLNFTATVGQLLEFRVYWHGVSYVRVDKVTIT